uniref:Small ribosomal subunit protein uS8 n=1 Tax=Leptospirillum ferriphilum TaxID=178606 RepID=A0A7C3QRW4_9BACT
MSMTDPIADLLTRIRNANMRLYDRVECQHSKIKEELLKILLEEGFISSYETIEKEGKKDLHIRLRYIRDRERVLRGIKRISTPGLRVYKKVEDFKSLMGGIGVTIISTSKGLMTDSKAKSLRIGGEVICQVW